uniref:Uncharacterized protein n=1 Tax=Anguilla anguilla TaxID=7936 RepID=A0A0E9TT43_ANGAN
MKYAPRAGWPTPPTGLLLLALTTGRTMSEMRFFNSLFFYC